MCMFLCTRYKQLLQRKGEVEELEKNLKEQQDKMALENQAHQATADQCKLLKDENDRSDQLVSKCLRHYLNKSKSAFLAPYNCLKLKLTSLNCVSELKCLFHACVEESFCSLLRLNSTYRQLLKDNENLQLDHKNIKSQLNSAKLEQTKLEAEFSKLKEQYQQLDITSTKLTNQCEVRSRLSSPLLL